MRFGWNQTPFGNVILWLGTVFFRPLCDFVFYGRVRIGRAIGKDNSNFSIRPDPKFLRIKARRSRAA